MDIQKIKYNLDHKVALESFSYLLSTKKFNEFIKNSIFLIYDFLHYLVTPIFEALFLLKIVPNFGEKYEKN